MGQKELLKEKEEENARKCRQHEQKPEKRNLSFRSLSDFQNHFLPRRCAIIHHLSFVFSRRFE
jgi:predicted transcriptional regulator